MLIIDFYGAPGAGKSTLASGLFSSLKDMGKKVSIISEAATDLIESGQSYLLVDPEYQLYVTSLQFRKIKDQERLGTEYLITDSPINHQLGFIKNSWLHAPLKEIYNKLLDKYPTHSVLVTMSKPFSSYKRITTEEDSKRIQEDLIQLRPYDLTVRGSITEIPKIIESLKLS